LINGYYPYFCMAMGTAHLSYVLKRPLFLKKQVESYLIRTAQNGSHLTARWRTWTTAGQNL